MRFFDAHNHLQDSRLLQHMSQVAQLLPTLPLAKAVVDGSGEDDWFLVADLAKAYPWVLPSFGVHPWYVSEQSPDWLQHLREILLRHQEAAVGEAGLDRWIPQPDLPLQLSMLRSQLQLATELQRPISLHCLRAFGLLLETLQTEQLPSRGFLLHSYGGPVEMVPQFVRLGAYFSVSPYFLHPRKSQQWATFAQVPLHRLLVETDAPDMWPPDELNPLPLQDSTGKPINHPANIQLIYQHLARLRAMPLAELAGVVEENFTRLFL
jgi:TatD DNase family protein